MAEDHTEFKSLGNVDMNTFRINNVVDPAVAQDAATKNYHDTNPPTNSDKCFVTDSAGQVIANLTWTALDWDTENYDLNAMHSCALNPSRIKIKTAGYYLVIAQVNYEGNTTGVRGMAIRKNGTVDLRQSIKEGEVDNQLSQNVVTVESLAVNDYLEVRVWQNSGGNLNYITAGSAMGFFIVIRMF